ncbi:MAG: general secretion pathway protein GspK [Planctomycetes bacterium]|nr:general secretion pathway protein GspK [Planctomycetota bacterium]
MSIVLAMLVLFVLMVVVFEVKFDATVELDHARATVETARMRYIADAAFQQARSALLMDVEAAAGEATDAGGPGAGDGLSSDTGDSSGGPMGPGGGGGGGGDGGGDGSGDEGGDAAGTGNDITDVIARTDSLLDDWQDSVALAPPLGNDYTLFVEVEDEDSKINLLGLWTGEVQQREALREVVRRLLDKQFEGTSLDFSFTDATELLDNLDDWVKGDRGSFDPVPKPPLKPSNADDAAAADELEAPSLDSEEKNYPLTLQELLLIEGIQPAHLTGFVEDGDYYPGLESCLTIWSQLELKPEPPVEDEYSGSPFTQGSLFDDSLEDGADDEESAEDDEAASVQPTNDGLINANTAPLSVLRALAPDEIPTSFLEHLVEFRERIRELRKEGKLYGSDSLFDDPQPEEKEEGDGAGTGEGGGLFGDEDDDDPTKYVFDTTEDIITKVEEEFGIELKVEPDIEAEFVGYLAVTSQVFTIKVLVWDQKTDRRTSWRSVVWRMTGLETPLCLTLVPLEPYHDARRLKDFPDDIKELSEERFVRWTEDGYLDPSRQ